MPGPARRAMIHVGEWARTQPSNPVSTKPIPNALAHAKPTKADNGGFCFCGSTLNSDREDIYLATALPDTELCRVVMTDAACGLVVPPENPTAMADAMRALAANPARRAEMGANGRRYAEAEMSQDVILRRFETQLLALVQGVPA